MEPQEDISSDSHTEGPLSRRLSEPPGSQGFGNHPRLVRKPASPQLSAACHLVSR